MATQHTDEKARTRIREALGETLFVEAGAGTGKTTALVGRIVNLVAKEGIELQGIAAITFTRKAAGELRDRVRQKLEQAAAGEGDFTDVERERCRAAATQVDAAAMETLDAFAARIVSEHPLEAGLPPRFEMQDEVQAAIAFDERWETFAEGLFEDPALEPLFDRALILGLKPDHLRETARLLVDHWDRLDENAFPDAPLSPVDAGIIFTALRDACSHIPQCTNTEDALYGHLCGLQGYADALEAAPDEVDLLDLLLNGKPIKFSKGQQPNWSGVKPKDIRDLLTETEAARAELLANLRAEVLPILLRRICRFVTGYAEDRRREGRQGFHDILIRARDLLLQNTDVREAAHNRYQRLLIDEFQDTDPLQIEIAVLIAGTWDGQGIFDWRTAPVPDGRLFFVGDPKQSIYRFRRADIALYQSVQDRFSASVVHLQRNFRSQSRILSWVNAVFGKMMLPGGGQADYVGLEPPVDAPEEAAVHWLGGPSADEKPSADGLRQAEADEIAQAVKTVISEKWTVRDPETKAVRKARYEDIAILLPTRTPLPILERALEDTDIPFRVEARSLIYDTEEVRNLLSVLRALNDPTDEVALLAALRSPAFACADDELYAFRKAGGRWNFRDPGSSLHPAHPVLAAMGWLRETHEERWALGLSGTVEKVLRERHYYELALSHRRPRDHWKRLRLVMDQARDAAEAGATGLGPFLRFIDQLKDARGSTSDSILPDPDDDAVRILTIHAAKGLEFPVTVMAGLTTNDASRQDSVRMAWNGTRPEFKIGSKDHCFQTEDYETAALREEEMQAKEDVRLLYVAATRARDHLLLSLHHDGRDTKESHARRLHAHAVSLADLCGLFSLNGHAWTAPPRGLAPCSDGREDRATWEARREARIEASGTLPAMAATAVAKKAQEALQGQQAQNPAEDEALNDASTEEAPPWKRGRAGTSLGRAVHAVLQSIDFGAGDDVIAAAARHQATAEGLPDREREVARLVKSALNSRLVRETVTQKRHYWREVYVSTVVNGVTLEGFIDLLIETPDGYIVVDFKTDKMDPKEAIQRYRLQGASYALCVKRMLGEDVCRCTFLFVQSGREEDVEDLEAACGEVMGILCPAG